MCPDDVIQETASPLLPSRCDSLFDSEAGSDVTFLVGLDSELWRFPGHRDVLAAANPVFRAMLHGPLASEPSITINDVDGRAFNNLLCYLYREKVVLQSVATAEATLQAADKYMCDGLVRFCIHYLDMHLDSTNVLSVLQLIRLYSNEEEEQQNILPSAPPLDVRNNSSLNNGNEIVTDRNSLCIVKMHYNALLNNCLEFIDLHADEVLMQECIEDLDLETLILIAERDTLGISTELCLFNALNRWCNSKCKKERLELSPTNHRNILGNRAIYSVRYCLMSSEDFISGPVQSGLLNQTEISVFLSHILKHSAASNTCSYLQEILPRLKTPRSKPRAAFVELSPRSASKFSSEYNVGQQCLMKKDLKREARKHKKQKGCPLKDGCGDQKRNKSSCIAEYVCRALSCIFD